MLIKAVFYRKITMFEKNILELKCLFKEKEHRIALSKGPAISINGKSRAKKARLADPAVSRPEKLRETSMCSLVLFFAIPFQIKGVNNCFEQRSCNFCRNKRPKPNALAVSHQTNHCLT